MGYLKQQAQHHNPIKNHYYHIHHLTTPIQDSTFLHNLVTYIVSTPYQGWIQPQEKPQRKRRDKNWQNYKHNIIDENEFWDTRVLKLCVVYFVFFWFTKLFWSENIPIRAYIVISNSSCHWLKVPLLHAIRERPMWVHLLWGDVPSYLCLSLCYFCFLSYHFLMSKLKNLTSKMSHSCHRFSLLIKNPLTGSYAPKDRRWGSFFCHVCFLYFILLFLILVVVDCCSFLMQNLNATKSLLPNRTGQQEFPYPQETRQGGGACQFSMHCASLHSKIIWNYSWLIFVIF